MARETEKLIVGLTGRYCAGKDAVARILAANGFTVIDVDGLGHEALAARAGEIAAAFGPGVRAADGSIDRRALGRIVFGDPAALSRLEAISHPFMVERVRAIAAEAVGDVVINAAVLQRMGLDALCGAIVFVAAPYPVRLARAMKRDRLSVSAAMRRLGSQGDIGPRSKRPQHDGKTVDTYTVGNWGSVRSLERRAGRLALRLKGRS